MVHLQELSRSNSQPVPAVWTSDKQTLMTHLWVSCHGDSWTYPWARGLCLLTNDCSLEEVEAAPGVRRYFVEPLRCFGESWSGWTTERSGHTSGPGHWPGGL